jgi:hypothetical protein
LQPRGLLDRFFRIASVGAEAALRLCRAHRNQLNSGGVPDAKWHNLRDIQQPQSVGRRSTGMAQLVA